VTALSGDCGGASEVAESLLLLFLIVVRHCQNFDERSHLSCKYLLYKLSYISNSSPVNVMNLCYLMRYLMGCSGVEESGFDSRQVQGICEACEADYRHLDPSL
jgi:hypothetical protein